MEGSWIGAGVVGAAAGVFLVKARVNFRRLPEVVGPAVGNISALTVIVPARNEEANIGRVVASFPGVRVVVVDDQSSDRTAEKAREAGAEVVEAPALPEGWQGKPHACWVGARQATTEWLLFVDADTWYDPVFAGSIVRYAEAEELDGVSAFLQQVRESWAERVLLPYAFALYFCGVSAKSVNSLDGREALANGQCLLMRREAYDRIDGHRAVASSVIEDVALAAVAKRHRLRMRVVRAEALGRVRMYDGLGAIWRGFQKNSFRFLLANAWTGVQVVAASVVLTSYVPVLCWLGADGAWGVAGAFALGVPLLLAPWYGGPQALLYGPLAIYLFQAVALWGMVTTALGRTVAWKGRPV